MAKPLLETLRQNMRQALSQNRLGDAEEILDRLKKENPLSLDTRAFELEFYLSTNRLREANALARQLCRLFPESAWILFLAGKVAYRQKRYLEAESHFRESLRIQRHGRTQHWLGKTLTQTGQFQEAEALLLGVREHNPYVHTDLAWLYERKNDLEAALKSCEAFLAEHPDNRFAIEQRTRLRGKLLEPESFIEEMGTLSDLGEKVPEALLPDFVQKLFETGQGPRARDEITARLGGIDARLATRLAWVCHHASAYDLSCVLFLAALEVNLSDRKYLVALESAAAKCRRLTQVLEAYRAHAAQVPHLYGRIKSLTRRIQPAPKKKQSLGSV